MHRTNANYAMKSIALSLLLALAAWAQPDPSTPAFEVASVKVSPPVNSTITATGARVSVMRGCGKPDPTMVHCTGATLKMLLMRAYEVKPYQIEGPAWINSEGYDIMAKVPEGVPASKIPAMLQALLAERFGVKLHKETRNLPAYELGVAKGGSKLKEVDASSLPATPEPGSALPALPRGPSGPPALNSMPPGAIMMSMRSDGARTVRGNMTMEQLVTHLANSLNRPVFDNTGIKGTFAIDLAYLADETDGSGMMIVTGGPGPGPGPGGGAPHPEADAPVATLSQAVQQTLGLKLEARKAPVDMIVLDSANKVPTEN